MKNLNSKLALLRASVLLLSVTMLAACKKDVQVTEQKNAQVLTPSQAGPVAVKGEPFVIRLRGGSQIGLSKVDDKFFMDGDIQLSQQQIKWLQANDVKNTITTHSAFKIDFATRWPDKTVYYTISSQAIRPLVLQAINNWQSSTFMRFVERTNQANYVDFVENTTNPDAAGESALGMIGGRQEIKLNAGGLTAGVVIHEIGHTVGLYHEQSRADRDYYVTVNFNNIKSSFTDQYKTYLDRNWRGAENGPYDFQSVMGYESYYSSVAANNSGAWQITRKDYPNTFIYQGSSLSPGDVKGVEAIYAPIYITYDVQDQGSYYDEFNDVRELEVYANFYKDGAHQQPGLPRTLRFVIIKTRNEDAGSGDGRTNSYIVQYTPVTVGETTSSIYLGHESHNMHYNQRMDMEPGSYTESVGLTNIQ